METNPESKDYDGHEISFIDDCFSVLDNEADISGDDDEQEEERIGKDVLPSQDNPQSNESDSQKQSLNPTTTVETSAFYWSYSNLNLFDNNEYENYQKRNSQRASSSYKKNDDDSWDENYSSLTDIYEANKNFGGDNLLTYTLEDFKESPFKRSDFEFETFYDWESSVEEQKQSNDSEYFIETVSMEEKAGRELYPVFERFVSDLSLKPLLLKHLYYFCKLLSAEDRIRVAQKFGEFMTMEDANSFRLRTQFAEQLILMIPLYDVLQVNHFFSGFALTFSADKISDVRTKGIELLAEVVGLLINEEWDDEVESCTFLTQKLLQEIRVGFWISRNWRQRQSFGRLLYILLSKKLITDKQLFYLFFDDLMRLFNDPVPNVRQYFCMLAQLIISESDLFEAFDMEKSDTIKTSLSSMVNNDSDSEIRYLGRLVLDNLEASKNGMSSV